MLLYAVQVSTYSTPTYTLPRSPRLDVPYRARKLVLQLGPGFNDGLDIQAHL